MVTCKEITELATDYAEGHLAEADRLRFVAHIAGCHGCETWVRQLAATSQAVGALPELELPVALRSRLEALFDVWATERLGSGSLTKGPPRSRSRRRFTLIPALATVAAFGLLVGLERRPSTSPSAWAAAIGVVAVAVALVVLRRHVTLGFAAIGASAAVVAAAVTGGRGALDEAGGLECLLTIGITAAGAVAAAWVVLRHEPREVLGSAMGAWAVSGALAAVGALQVACGTRSSMAHLLTFHVGGLLAVTAVALLVARRHAAPARS